MRKGRTGTETRLPTVEMVPTDGDDKGTLEGFNQSRTGLKTRTLFDVLHAFSSPFVVFFESHSTVCLRNLFGTFLGSFFGPFPEAFSKAFLPRFRVSFSVLHGKKAD